MGSRNRIVLDSFVELEIESKHSHMLSTHSKAGVNSILTNISFNRKRNLLTNSAKSIVSMCMNQANESPISSFISE